MADEKETTEVSTVNTDLTKDDSPFDSNGFVGVDPYFQSPVLEPKSSKTEKEEEEVKEEAPAVNTPPATPIIPPKP